MYNDDNRWNDQRKRYRDTNDSENNYNDDRYRDERWPQDEGWNDRRTSPQGPDSYTRGASRSGYGSSMSSQGGGYGSDPFYNDNDGYMRQSRYADYGSDYRRYTDNYNDRGMQNHDSRRYNEQRSRGIQRPYFGQSYESAYGDGGRGNHMGYGEKGAQYRDDFNGEYGAGNRNERGYSGERSKWNDGYRVRNRDHYRDLGPGTERELGSDSYFMNTQDEAYRQGHDHWNIGNYGERSSNDQGYGYGDDDRDNRNRQNYTW
jgi:hypothetical protein